MAHVPASIRSRNPGAMWPGAISKKWGSVGSEALADGTGQGNKIAYFDTWVAGICAQIDLWMNSPNYKNKRFEDAIAIWSGHNSVPQYIDFVKKRVPGLSNSTVMDRTFWFGPMAIPFLKAQAWHEAGQQYPAPEGDWQKALDIVLGGGPAAKPEKQIGQLIRIGDQGPGVGELQRRLSCAVTEVYNANSETEFALRLFQIRNGLDPDGKCGSLTWAKLQPEGKTV